MESSLDYIAKSIEKDLIDNLERSGIMYRMFSRVKTIRSIRRKMEKKGDAYRGGGKKMQDIIGFRIVLYFSDDVDILSFFLGCKDVVKSAVDEPDSNTFCPQRLNLTRNIPKEYVETFRKCLPEEFANSIDNTYEVQIRTIFSEGWHEVEHDLRYKCQYDWDGCEQYNRILNGVIATLETAEWSMKSLFHQMSSYNYEYGNYRAMLRNKFRIRLKDDDFSPAVTNFLNEHKNVAESLLHSDRFILLLSMLNHKTKIDLTFDNVLFIINRIDILNDDLKALENDDIRLALDNFLKG